MSKNEKLTIAKFAIQHPNASYDEWLRVAAQLPNLRVRENYARGQVEISLHRGGWKTSLAFVTGYKNMVIRCLKEEWSRASQIFSQEEILAILHINESSCATDIQTSEAANKATGGNVSTAESIRSSVHEMAAKMREEDRQNKLNGIKAKAPWLKV